MHVSRKRAVAGLSLAVAATGFLAQPPASANPAGTGLVISEVYGAGGNAGARYNATSSSSTTRPPRRFRSPASVGPVPGSDRRQRRRGVCPQRRRCVDAHYLIQMSATGAVGAALPTPDATASRLVDGGRRRPGLPPQWDDREHNDGQHGRQPGHRRHGGLRADGHELRERPDHRPKRDELRRPQRGRCRHRHQLGRLRRRGARLPRTAGASSHLRTSSPARSPRSRAPAPRHRTWMTSPPRAAS